MEHLLILRSVLKRIKSVLKPYLRPNAEHNVIRMARMGLLVEGSQRVTAPYSWSIRFESHLRYEEA